MGNISGSKAFQSVPLVGYGIALIGVAIAIIGGVQEMAASVPGGLAVLLIALIMLALVAWRINFKWRQLHGRNGGPSSW